MSTSSKSESARLGHIKRLVNQGEPLTGDLLKLALDLVGNGATGQAETDGIAVKLKAGQKLSDYEHHLMVDVFLLHARLSAAAAARAADEGTPPIER